MTISRMSQKTVTFQHPFQLHGRGEIFPAGSYVVDTTEELVEGISFTVYRRVATQLHMKSRQHGMLYDRLLDINPIDLDFALVQDADPDRPAHH